MSLNPQFAIRNSQWWRCGLVCVVIVAGCARPTTPASLLSPLVSPLLPSPKPPTLLAEPFDALNLQRWREVEVKGRTVYTIEEFEGSRSLKAQSRDGASILLHPFRFDPDTYEWVSWRWRVDQPIVGEDLARKEGSDAAARVYVYFDTAGLPWQKRNIDYVWSAHLPKETLMTSVFSKSSKILVVENSTVPLGTWQTVHRNIEEDYRRCFGENPPDVVAIGLMVDTDSTHSEAVAYFDDLMISREPHPVLPQRSLDAAGASTRSSSEDPSPHAAMGTRRQDGRPPDVTPLDTP